VTSVIGGALVVNGSIAYASGTNGVAVGGATGAGAFASILAGSGTIGSGTATTPGVAGRVTINTGVNPGVITAGSGATALSTTGHLTTTGGPTYSQVWTGSATVAQAGSYDWKLNTSNSGSSGAASPNTTLTADPGVAAGSNWDVLTMTMLNVVAGTGGSEFNVVVVPVTQTTGTPFNASQGNYTWPIADITSSNGIFLNGTNINANSNTPAAIGALQSAFHLDVSQLAAANPSVNLSSYSVGLVSDGGLGEDIVINYSGAPEPTSFMLLGLGAGGLMLGRRRRKTVTASI
jgi:hypothetical protein